MENRETFARIWVELEDGATAVCYVGGEVIEDLHRGVHKVWVKPNKSVDKASNNE